MKIAVFGCSWSYGVKTQGSYNDNKIYSNWPFYLHQQTGWEIKNYSFGGTCIAWSINNLLSFKEKYKDYKIIFQATSPHRYTHIKSNYNTFSQREEYNKYESYNKSLKGLECINLSRLTNTEQSNYFVKTLELYPEKYYNNYIHMQKNIIEKFSDIFFTHTYNTKKYFQDWPCMQQHFDKDFNNWVIDDGYHFNKEGLYAQAEYIKELVNASRTS